MRRLAALGLLVALLVVIPATPALAYKRKRTVTVGVDPQGVPIRIDLAVTDAGTSTPSTGRTGGGGPACQYDLASAGSGGLYAGKPLNANLYSITCGAYTDVRWLRSGPNGQPLQPGPTVDPVQLALSARDRLPVPTGGIGANPARSLVGLPTWFWYQGYDGRPLTKTVAAFGVTSRSRRPRPATVGTSATGPR